MHALLGELARTGGFPPRTVLVLDEAGMAPTRLTAELFARAERAGVKVIAVGDSGQLGSVEAGGWLAALSRRQAAPALREVIRQRDPQERRALEALHDGEPDRYLAHKQEAITVHATETGALSAVVEQWHLAQREHGRGSAVMIARDNHTREQLNRAAREQLKRDGALPPHGTRVVRREYAPGDRVMARRNDRRRDVDNGTLGTVTEIDGRGHRMLLETDSGELRELDLAYVARHVEHAYALTGHGAQSGTVTWVGVIGRPEEFTREWAYTALSRARNQTVLHVIAERSDHEHEREHYGPAVRDRSRRETLGALQRAMKHSEVEPLALERLRHGSELDSRVAQARVARQRVLERLAQQDAHRTLARPAPLGFRPSRARWPRAPARCLYR
jgi:ATP-dependent exoDNAse (exonuclease V) alpha subunit